MPNKKKATRQEYNDILSRLYLQKLQFSPWDFPAVSMNCVCFQGKIRRQFYFLSLKLKASFVDTIGKVN